MRASTFISELQNLSGGLLPVANERLGRVTRVVGMTIEASGISAEIGAQCVKLKLTESIGQLMLR